MPGKRKPPPTGDLPKVAAKMHAKVYERMRKDGHDAETAARGAWCTVDRFWWRGGKGGAWVKRKKPLPAVGDAPCPSPSQAKRKSKRGDNPSAPKLGELGLATEIGRVHELVVKRPDGQLESHAWSGRHPLLIWSPRQRALVFAYGGKLARPKRGEVPRDDGAAATSERFEGKRATFIRDNRIPAVKLDELGAPLFLAYRGSKWRNKVVEHKLGRKVRAWMGTRGKGKVYALAGGNLRLTGRGIEG